MPGHTGNPVHTTTRTGTDIKIKTEAGTISNQPSACLND
jgi:hypothetical protein